MNRVVADSNILISAILRGGKPRDLLNLAKNGEIDLALSEDILNETLGVLARKFRRTPVQLQEDEAYLRGISLRVEARERVEAVEADPDDDKVLACAVAAGAAAIISGDRHLLDLGEFRGMPIMTVANFLARGRSR